MSKEYLINDQISAEKVQMVMEDGSFNSSVPIKEALAIAENLGLDLVAVAGYEGANPVCKLLNYEKIKYQEAKNKKPNSTKDTKEIRFSYNIGDNDLRVKNKKVIELIDKGHRVKYVLQLKGREKAMVETAKQKMQMCLSELEEKVVWTKIDISGHNSLLTITVLLSPK